MGIKFPPARLGLGMETAIWRSISPLPIMFMSPDMAGPPACLCNPITVVKHWSEVTFYLIIIPPVSPTNLAREHKHFPHHGVGISADKTEISNLNIVREGSGRNTDRLTEPRQTRNCLIFLIADNQCNTMPGQWLVTISPSRYNP